MRTRYRAIAHVVKTHGNKGEVVAVPVGGLPLLLHEGLSVCVVPPRLKGDRIRAVVSCETSDAGQLIALRGVDNLDKAHHLVGKTLLARTQDLPANFALHDATTLIGRTVVDERYGELGSISEVMRGPAQDVWVVQGGFGEVLVPVAGEFVEAFDSEGPIRVRLPEGLVTQGTSDDGPHDGGRER